MWNEETAALYEGLTNADKTRLEQIVRILLGRTFIVRDKDEDGRRNFTFCRKYEALIKEALRFTGYDISVDREAGVVMLYCRDSIHTNRIRLLKRETIVLCCLWTIYVSHINDGSFARSVTAPLSELLAELEKYNIRDRYPKTVIWPILKKFEKYNLITVDGKLEEETCTIRMYMSMQFCLDFKEFEEYSERLGKMWQEEEAKREQRAGEYQADPSDEMDSGDDDAEVLTDESV